MCFYSLIGRSERYGSSISTYFENSHSDECKTVSSCTRRDANSCVCTIPTNGQTVRIGRRVGLYPLPDDGDDKLDMRRFFDKRRMSLGNYTVEECFDARISVNGAVFVEKYHGAVAESQQPRIA